MLAEADLPDDVDALRALVLDQSRRIKAFQSAQAEVERLKAIIDALQRHRFGRRSEQLDPGQLELCLEEVETAIAQAEATIEANASKPGSARPRETNRRSLPAHLERIGQVVDVDSKDCPCCGGTLHQVGEDVSPMRNAPAALALIETWIEGYNDYHPHPGLKMRSPRDFRPDQVATSWGVR